MLPARDGVRLAATLFEPATPNGAAILVNSGTGIPRQFYGAFANHLAGHGFAVLTLGSDGNATAEYFEDINGAGRKTYTETIS